ncbi:MAG: alkaline shock response rane anchor protein AmaP [Bacillota bacterium]|jgi:uncharacterized alkaline shock family protein YloU
MRIKLGTSICILFGLLVGVLFIIACTPPVATWWELSVDGEIIEHSEKFLMLGIVSGAFIFLFHLTLLKLIWKRSDKARKQTFLQQTELGDIRLSWESITEIVSRASRNVRGVRGLHVGIKHGDKKNRGALRLKVKVHVDGNRPFKELTKELQQQIYYRLEHIAGLKVRDISIYIHKVVQNTKSALRVG